MLDKKEFNFLRICENYEHYFSQFKEFNCEDDLTPIVQRMYYLMVEGNLPRGENESLYGWCGRLGLSNSTIFGIFKKHNKYMHLSVADKISQATGANIEWIQHGTGQPFKANEMVQTANQLKERIKMLMTDDEQEHPYKFATRTGLSKGTFTGIWVAGRDTLHQKTIDKISNATGCNATWLATGHGKPFSYTFEDAVVKNNDDLAIDKSLLLQAIKTAEQALEITEATMPPALKAEFICTLYFSEQHNKAGEELLSNCVLLIEQALLETRHYMSHDKKTDLISVIYNFYIDKQYTQEHLKRALYQLIRSVGNARRE